MIFNNCFEEVKLFKPTYAAHKKGLILLTSNCIMYGLSKRHICMGIGRCFSTNAINLVQNTVHYGEEIYFSST